MNHTVPSPQSTPPGGPHAPAPVRMRLDLAYDGTAFHGWAEQPGLRTVEGVLCEALRTVLRVPVRLTVAGRTDAGVHASAQVAHGDVPGEVWRGLPGRSARSSEEALHHRLTGVLARESRRVLASGLVPASPKGASDLVVHAVRRVPAAFDARFSALERRYLYRIADAEAPHDPLRRHQVLWHPGALDTSVMNQSFLPLVGEHDFMSFCKPREGATTIRTVQHLRWTRVPEGPDAGLVVLEVAADAFCHSMVRSFVGAGIAVGKGVRAVDWPARLLAARSREVAAPVAPPHGLTLVEVSYPAPDALGEQARRARTLRRLAGTGPGNVTDVG